MRSVHSVQCKHVKEEGRQAVMAVVCSALNAVYIKERTIAMNKASCYAIAY